MRLCFALRIVIDWRIDNNFTAATFRLQGSLGDLTGPFCCPPAVAAGAYCGWFMLFGVVDLELAEVIC